MGEFDYIAWLRQQTLGSPRVLVGPGDDCAVLSTTGVPWLVTTDMLLDGSHFVLADVGPRRVGRKAMAVNLSDIAAMAGRPVAAFVSVGLPRGNTKTIAEELYLGMRDLGDQFDTVIAGGDTNSWTGGLVVSVTMLGEPGPQGPILRSGAKPGDWLFVTGAVGGSILGKHLDFTPRIREALALQAHAKLHAMIDISDGLSADVYHICEESGCGVVLLAQSIPLSDAVRGLDDPLTHALSDGEDFELAFAVDPADGERLLKTQPIEGITLSHIGAFVEQLGFFIEDRDGKRRCMPAGYSHPFA